MSTFADQHSKHIHALHHVLFPTTDPERTEEFYSRVLGLRRIPLKKKAGPLDVVLMTNGNFDLHFTPVKQATSLKPYHFALEVEDWDSFIAHLDEIGIHYSEIRERPQNNSKTTDFEDPDGHLIEVVWHGDRDW